MNNVSIKPSPRVPPFIRVYGTHREIGRQIGQAAAPLVRHSLENARLLMDSAYERLQLSWEGAQIQSRKYLPFVEERYPQLLDELEGIAEGADVPFDDIMVLNALEAVTMDALHLTKCTSLAVNQERSENGHVLIGHNEDWLPEDEPDILIVHGLPDNEPAFLAMTYGGLLPNIGFNSAGIAQCCDSVYASDSRIGIPRVIASRAVLAAQSPAEAIRSMLVPLRAAGYNHLLAHDSGELYSIEVSARRFAVLGSENGAIAHTNHYLDLHMREIEDEPDEVVSTRVRYFRAARLLRLKEKHTVDSIQAILKDHVNYPDSICRHTDENREPLDREKTITSLAMDLTDRVLLIARGNPCQNGYTAFQMN